MIFETFSREETYKLGMSLGSEAKEAEVYCLSGDLGTGKTVFAKGFALSLGVADDITSPTFALVNEYTGRLPFYHFDVYRIRSVSELEDTGFEDYLYSNGVCLIEWAELVKEALPHSAVWINISKNPDKGDNYRLIEITGKA